MEAPNLPILYSFRRCPYAMRARMSLVSAGIRCELREVVLRDKPAEMIAVSPKATVPVLQLPDGLVIDESIDIMQWALAHGDPGGWLRPESATIEEALDLIEETETKFKPHLDRYKYPDRYPGEDAIVHRSACSRFLASLEERLADSPYLFGNEPCIADIAIFPFVRQFANTDRDWFDASVLLNMQVWLQKLITSPLFEKAMKKYPQWRNEHKAVFFPE